MGHDPKIADQHQSISGILLNRAPNPTDGKIQITYGLSEASVPNKCEFLRHNQMKAA